MHTNSVLPWLPRWYRRIILLGQHYKFGFGNGRITNVMASDGGSLSKVTSSLCCVLQWKLAHYWMGKTPCSESIVVSNATSTRINSTNKKGWGIIVDTFAHYGEENSMTDIPSRSFGSNLSWFCKNETDLLNLFNKHFPLPNQASWTTFSPSNAVTKRFCLHM